MITVARIVQKKGNFYQVELSNGESIRLSEDLLVRYRLLKGQEFSEEDLQEIRKKIGYDLGLQIAMNYLSYQIRSEKEVFTYLKEKEIEPEDRKSVVIRLKELSLVDDLKYAESYVRTQMRLSDKGPQHLAQQLKQKGISQENIELSLELYTLKNQLEIATRAGEKYLKRVHHKSRKETQQKLKQQLMKNGFPQEVIQEALLILEEEPNEDEEYESLAHQGERLWRKNRSLDTAKRNLKIKQNLYQKGFSMDLIQRFLDEKIEEAQTDE